MYWLWSVVLLAIITTATCASYPVETINDDTTHGALTIYKSRNDSNVKRNDKNNTVEERGVGIPVIETLTNALKATDDIDDWISKGVSTDNVFKLLALDKASDNLLANPRLKTWINYMKRFNEGNQEQKTSVIATLTAYYGDVGLAKIIEAAKQVKGTAVIAKRLQNEQIYRWLGAGKSPEDVFKVLKLDKTESTLFEQPQFVTWAAYLDKFNKEHPASKTTLFSFVNPRYKDEGMLVEMLMAAEKVPTTKNIAVRIQAEQTKLWLRPLTVKDPPRNPGYVFEVLKLNDHSGVSLFKDPLFVAWLKYTDEYRMIYFGENDLTSISLLIDYYDVDILAKMILRAGQSSSSSTSGIANRLYEELLRNWKIHKSDPKDVFKQLKLKKTKDALFDDPLFNVWSNYVNYYSNFKPKEDISLLTELAKVYTERQLTAILVAAYNAPRTNEFATNLLIGQLNRWLSARINPGKVFSILNMKGVAANDVRRWMYHTYRDVFARIPGIKKRKRTKILNTPNSKTIRD